MNTRMYDPVEIARQFLFVREAGANSGLRVEAMQKWCDGDKGQSWCAYFATMILDLCYQGDAPVRRQGLCEDIHQQAIREGWLVDAPQPGDLFLYVTDGGHAHHIGIVTQIAPLTGIAGNTSEDGASSNGDRVAEHPINAAHCVFVRVPEC